MKKKVLFLANNDVGLYRFRKELIERLLSDGIEVHLCLPKGEFINEFVQMGCFFHDVKIDRRGINPLYDIQTYRTFKKVINDVSPDSILTYTIKPNIYGNLAKKNKKINSIMTITGLGTAFQTKGPLRMVLISLYRKAIKSCGYVFFQNEENHKLFRDLEIVSENKVVLVPGSGVNIDDYKVTKYSESEVKKIIFIGRVMNEKGIREYISLAKEKSSDPTLSFHIYGEKEEKLDLLDDVIKNNIVLYHGKANNIHEVLSESYAVVLPSYHEGMSNVLLETAASGRVALASDIPGCREIIENKITGFLFKKKNEVSLLETFEILMSLSKDEVEQMGLAARVKVVEEFNRKIVIDKYLDKI